MAQQNLPEWDLSDLFPGIESNEFKTAQEKLKKDTQEFIHNKEELEGGDISSSRFLELLQEFESIEIQMLHLYAFCHLQYDVDTTNQHVKKALDAMKSLVTDMSSKLEFFTQAVKNMSDEAFSTLVESPELSKYKHYLEILRIYKPYTLSEREEQLLTLKSLHGSQAWGQFHTELSGSVEYGELEVNGEKIKMTPAKLGYYLSSSTDRNVRKDAYTLGRKPFKDWNNLYSFAYNAVISDFEQDSVTIRGFESGLARGALNEEVKEEDIENMVSVVTEKKGVYQDFFKWKKEYMKLSDFASFDMSAPITDKRPEVPFDEGKKMVLDCFHDFDPEISELANKFFENNWIDAREGSNKYAGAFSWSMEMHPYVLLNYQPSYRQVFTMVHELGHGVHNLLTAKEQPFLMRNNSKVIAESASQFSEILLLDYLFENSDDTDLKRDLLETHVGDLLYCLSSTITVTAFEIESHKLAMNGGVNSDTLCDLWEKLHQDLIGGVIERTENDRYAWARIPHIFQSPYYYYTYPMSLLVVLALYDLYTQDKEAFVPKYKAFLSCGINMTPAELIKTHFDLDFGSKEFYERGYHVVEKLIDKLKNL